MTKIELIEELERQLDLLKSSTGFPAHKFDLWDKPEAIPVIRWDPDTWWWGVCTSETCAHNSHDPMQSGGTAFVMCRPIGLRGGYEAYETEDGLIFIHNTKECGFHYAPNSSLVVC